MTKNIERAFKGNVGVFHVAAKLSEMNIVALVTSRNTSGYDIVAFNPQTNKGKGIQVKCTDRKDFPITNTFLRTITEELDKKIRFDFVFVDISSEFPNFYLLSKTDVCKIIKDNAERGLAKSKHPEELKQSTKKVLHSIKLEQLQDFKDKWNIILR